MLSHLRDFVRRGATVPVIFLHVEYTLREAPYLANTYASVWVDIGEVFPFLSQNELEIVSHELLELSLIHI